MTDPESTPPPREAATRTAPRERNAADPDSSRRRNEPAVVEVEGLTKSYLGPNMPVVDRFSLRVARGETMALLGPSGCGKTTLLRLIAGFERPDEGSVRISGRTVTDERTFLPPEARRIGFVFQDYALFPHLDVVGNVAFGLSGRPARERRERVREVLDLVGLTVFARRHPGQLSGGQQQRVALARALAPGPEVILLDEPFSNLDAALRAGTREEVRRILERSGATTILVTHDQEEAMTFSDRLAVMRAGRLEQEGAPEETYLVPRTAFVAGFLGRTNLLRGVARGSTVDTRLGTLPLTREAQGPVLVSLRPEDLVLDEDAMTAAEPGVDGVRVIITLRSFQGHDLVFRCAPFGSGADVASHEPWLVRTGPGATLREGQQAWLRVLGSAVPLEGSQG